jgi:hypothetical protein
MNFAKGKSPAINGLAHPVKPAAANTLKRGPVVAQLKTVPSAQSIKRPVAPPVYRPQPNRHVAQPKIAKPAQIRSGAIQLAQTIQSRSKSVAPAVYKVGPPKTGPRRPATPPIFSSTPARPSPVQPKVHGARPITPPAKTPLQRAVSQQMKVHNPQAVTPKANSVLQRAVPQRAAAFPRPQTIQLIKIKDMWRYYKKKPLGDEQIAAEETIQELLAHDGEEDIGIKQAAQIAYVAHVRAAMGGDNTFEVKMASYFVGLRPDAPAAQVLGRGNLKVKGGVLVGRPGFLFTSLAAIDSSGPPGRAYRHKSAWHNLRASLNTISSRHGADEIDRLYQSIAARVPQKIAEEAHGVLDKSDAAAADRPMLWLGLVVNSAPRNLWLGPAKENISINSAASALKRWIAQLQNGTIRLAEFEAKILGAKFNSRKAQAVQAAVLQIIKESVGKDDPVQFIGAEVQRRALSRLEIDLPAAEEERGVSAHHERIFRTGLTRDVSDLGGHQQTIESLLGLEPVVRRRPSRGAQDDEQLERRGRSRSRRGSVDLESTKRERSRSYSRERPPVRAAAAAPLRQRPPRELSRSASGDSLLMPPPPPRPSQASRRERSRSRSGREAPASPAASPPRRLRLRRASSSASPPGKVSGSVE